MLNNISLENKVVLVRVDLNVPQNEDLSVRDNTRIVAAIPTISELISRGAKVVLMSHLGRPKGITPELTLKPIASELNNLLANNNVHFIEASTGESVKEKINSLDKGEVLLLENLRFNQEEEAGDEHFAKELASLGDYYINDAFGTAHRAHASTAVIANYFGKEHKDFGLLMKAEVENAEKVLTTAQKPYVAIIGGSKVSDKVGIIENLLGKVDTLLVGGAMAYTFIKAMGGNTGKSKTEDDKLELAKSLIEKAKNNNVKLLFPDDSVSNNEFTDKPGKTYKSSEIPSDYMGLDIGSQAIVDFSKEISSAKTILWNGPMGVFEFDNYSNGTKEVAFSVANATQNNEAFSLIGGGDSVAAINKFELNEKVSYISTGGGAMLEYLEGKELPGIKAIRD